MGQNEIIIHYHKTFLKHAQKYRAKKKAVEKSISLFQKNPSDPRLKTHKLYGKLAGNWSFSIDYHLRIMFMFIDKQTVLFIDIGTHEIYR